VTRVFRSIALLAAVVISAADAHAQLRRPRAAVSPLIESSAVRAGTSVRAALQVTLPEGLHTQSNKPRDPTLIPTMLTVDAPAGITWDEVVWPPAIDLNQVGQDKPLAVFERDFLIGVHLAVAPNAATGEIKIPAHLRYQACDANLCYPPVTQDVEWTLNIVAASAAVQPNPDAIKLFDKIPFGRGENPTTNGSKAPPNGSEAPRTPNGSDAADLAKLERFNVLGSTGGYLSASEFLTFIRNAESGVKERAMFEGRGPLAILLLVFLGGLALNLTPCVLPMIPINLAIIGAGTQSGIAGAPASSRSRGFLLGATYGGAMALVYGVLGVIVILTAGTFGTINSTAWFNAGIAILFVVLALAMFDIIEIDFSRYSSGFTPGKNTGTFIVAFTMGAVAALLAGACVAPVVIQVVLFSSNLYATGTTIALALPFCLGIGMALPWPIAGAGLAKLPKPGMWMVRVKQAFGVFILATAAYYGYEAYSIVSNRWVDASAVTSSVEEQIKTGWHANLGEGLDAAARDGKPVLIDMWATWCKNCLTMDKTTLQNADVKSALDKYVRIKFQAEDPDRPPAKPVMQRFNAVGLPAYVILRPAR